MHEAAIMRNVEITTMQQHSPLQSLTFAILSFSIPVSLVRFRVWAPQTKKLQRLEDFSRCNFFVVNVNLSHFYHTFLILDVFYAFYYASRARRRIIAAFCFASSETLT